MTPMLATAHKLAAKHFHPATWAYSSATSRDYRLDMLRGFLVLMMIVDHIGGDSLLTVITGKNQFLASAAEGFVFVSGTLLGIVYGNRIRRLGLATGVMALLRRAAVLYVATVGLTLAFIALYLFTEVPIWMDRASGLGVDTTLKALVGTLTLHFTYHGTDMLIIYVFMIAAAPLAFYALSKGHWAHVLGISWSIWALSQVAPAQVSLPWTVENSIFSTNVWQVLFYTGLVIGYHRNQLSRVARILGHPAVVAAAAVAFVGMMMLSRLHLADRLSELGLVWFDNDAFDIVFGKLHLGPGRIVAFAVVAILVWQLVTRLWQPLRLALGWLLMPLGQKALFAYGAHLFFIGPANAWFADALYGGQGGVLGATFVHGGAVVLVSLLARSYPVVSSYIQDAIQMVRNPARAADDIAKATAPAVVAVCSSNSGRSSLTGQDSSDRL